MISFLIEKNYRPVVSETVKPPARAPGAGRLMSLDVFRGATIAGMMLVNNPGSWSHIHPPLAHAEWHGWTFTDTIFPFFLWIVGVAIPLSISRRIEQGQSRKELFLHALRRAAIIFGLGIFLASFGYLIDGSIHKLGFGGWLDNYLTTVRIPGVLQRIAICYLAATAVFLCADLYRQISVTVGLLAAYWLIMALAPFSYTLDGQMHYASGLLEKGKNFSAYVDNLVLNHPAIGTHVWKSSGTWDPEGIVSTLPAIATCMFGVFAGRLLQIKRSEAEKTAWLMVGGALLMWLGQSMNLWLPINKNIWTSSYAVFMAGLAMICFGACYWLVDVQGHRKLAKPFAVYGMNAITVFVLSGVLGRLFNEIKIAMSPDKIVGLKTFLYEKFFSTPLASRIGDKNTSLLWAIGWVMLLYLVAWVMYRRKWFVKF